MYLRYPMQDLIALLLSVINHKKKFRLFGKKNDMFIKAYGKHNIKKTTLTH